MPPNSDHEQRVRQALLRFGDLVAARDLAIVEEFGKQEALLVGSLAGVSARGREELAAFFRRSFANPATISYAWSEVQVQVQSTIAWLYAEGHLIVRRDDAEQRLPYRVSGVLQIDGGRWLWRLFHGSEPKT